VLERLRERQPGHAQVRRLELGCARAAGDWGAVLGLLPGLAKDRIISERERDAFETEAVTALSAETKGLPSRTVLREVWERLPKARRAQPVLIALYARELAAAGQGEEAEKLVRAALNKHWDPNLICTYGQIHAGDGLRSIKHAEAWLAEHGPLPELLLTLGRLCIRAGLWGKARSYLEGLVGKAPSAEACRLLAETLEQLGDREAALRCHRQGLLIATGGSTAIPALPARQPG
jgi:HemY protein